MNELVPVKSSMSAPKFFLFDQNNSGGTFVYDTYLSEMVFIEAVNAEHANELAQGIGIYFDGCDSGSDCQCCGDRWYQAWDKGVSTPMVYSFTAEAEVPAEEYDSGWSEKEAPIRIHYLDGRIVECGTSKRAEKGLM